MPDTGIARPCAEGTRTMNLPKIDISSLPDLDTLTGIFGSLKNWDLALAGSNDLIIVLMVYLYEIAPPAPPPV